MGSEEAPEKGFINQQNLKTYNVKDQILNLVSKNQLDQAFELMPNSNDMVLLKGRWNKLKRDKMLGLLDFREEQTTQARIVSALLSYAGCDSDTMPTPKQAAQQTHTPQGWEPQLLQIIRENDRKNTDNVKRATTLLESFRSYHDLKRTRSFFDRSGEKLQEIQDEFEAFKKTLNKSENESVEKFIDRVAGLIDAQVPDWPSIKEAFILCVGRAGGLGTSLGGVQMEHLERIIQNQPNDDEAKLKIVFAIETFLGTL